MFSIGFGEFAVICIVLIIAVGPERLPGMMKSVGKTMRTLRQASRDIRSATGIDELMRDDTLYQQPKPQRPLPPSGPAPVSRTETPASASPVASASPEASSAPAEPAVPAALPAVASEPAPNAAAPTPTPDSELTEQK